MLKKLLHRTHHGWTEEDLLKLYVHQYCLNEHICLKSLMEKMERDIIFQILEETHGNQRSAALLLGLKPNTLHYKIRRMGIIPVRRYMMMENLFGSQKLPGAARGSKPDGVPPSLPRH